MNKQEHNIIVPNSISQLKKTIKKNKRVMIAGIIQEFSFQEEPYKNVAIVDIRKIKEFNTILKTVNSCTIGTCCSIQRILSLSEEIIDPLLVSCIHHCYYEDQWNMLLLQAIFYDTSPPLIRLFLTMVNARVQVLSDTITWVEMKDVMTNNATVNLNNSIPIQIQFDVTHKTKHILMAPPLKHFDYSIPVFTQAIIMGQIELNAYSQRIENVQLQLYQDGVLIIFNDYLKRIIGEIYPVSLDTIQHMWEHVPTQKLIPTQLQFLLQSLVALLSPELG